MRLIACLAAVLTLPCATATPLPSGHGFAISATTIDNGGGDDGYLDLAGSVTTDFSVSFEGNLGAQQLFLELDTGSVLNHPLGGETAPHAALTDAYASLAYDSFLTLGGWDNLQSNGVLQVGGAVNLTDHHGRAGPGFNDARSEFSDSLVNQTFAPRPGTTVAASVDFPIGRMTLSGDAFGEMYYFGSTHSGHEDGIYRFEIAGGVFSEPQLVQAPVIPSPRVAPTSPPVEVAPPEPTPPPSIPTPPAPPILDPVETTPPVTGPPISPPPPVTPPSPPMDETPTVVPDEVETISPEAPSAPPAPPAEPGVIVIDLPESTLAPWTPIVPADPARPVIWMPYDPGTSLGICADCLSIDWDFTTLLESGLVVTTFEGNSAVLGIDPTDAVTQRLFMADAVAFDGRVATPLAFNQASFPAIPELAAIVTACALLLARGASSRRVKRP